MSGIIYDSAKKGAETVLSLASQTIEKAIGEFGTEKPIGFPDTAFYLPVSFALLGKEARNLGDVLDILKDARDLYEGKGAGLLNISEMGGLLNFGIATLLSAEVIAAARYLDADWKEEGYIGFIPDGILRSLGVQLVDGRIAGVSVFIGEVPDSLSAVQLIRNAQKKNLISLLAGSTKGGNLREQLIKENVEIGLDTYVVPLGKDIVSSIFAVNFAIRAALSFGGIKKGEWRKCLEYCRTRLPVFCVALGYVDEITCAVAAGALSLGIPIVTNYKPFPSVGKIPSTLYEAVIVEEDPEKMISKGMEAKDIKIKVPDIDIPVSYSAAFEGERVRREQMHSQFGGKFSDAFEYVAMARPGDIEDGKIEVSGIEIDDIKEGDSAPLGIFVEVGGRKMQKDFEAILERHIHTFLNEAMGIFHMGQRDMCWIRISKEAKNKGFKLRHLGVILHARFHDVFNTIADKVRITIYTKEDDVKRITERARKAYEERDERVAGMTDESVDKFWTCSLCQSFAPNHICVVKPERIGLCGAYNWLDAKASYELNPSGPNQPIVKGEIIDAIKGEWKGVNEAVFLKSNRTLERFCGYSIMDAPETSCGCFECVAAILPEANGFIIVNREYTGMTPVGMGFSTLAGTIGGGYQTPGFMGIGRLYIASRKFISAEGGIKRIVWMPKELKESLRDRLEKRAVEEGEPDLLDKIADETIAVTSEDLLPYLEKVNHPALKMKPLI
jgi:acetyl-CoA synthase